MPSRYSESIASLGTRRIHIVSLLALACGMVFIFLVFRNWGLYSTVSGDENLYIKQSRLFAIGDSPVPDYLYLAVYRLTKVCGDGYFGCARLLNALFFVAAAAFVYLAARRTAGKRSSLFVAVLALVTPFNSYTAYFMPESLYFLGFWGLVWLLTGLTSASRLRSWVLAGALLGLLALVKPHALLLLPALVLHAAYLHFETRAQYRKGLAAAACLVATALVVKLAVGFGFAGKAGLSLFGVTYGSLYGSCTAGSAAARDCIGRLAPPFVQSLAGNMLATALMFALPLALAVAAALGGRFQSGGRSLEGGRSAHERTAFLCLSIVLSLVVATAAFSALVGEQGRIHQRYYNFAFPLFYLVCAGALRDKVGSGTSLVRALAAVVICVLTGYIAYTNLAGYAPNHVDSPELMGLYVNSRNFRVVCALLVAAAVFWSIRRSAGVRFYFYLVLPLTLLVSVNEINAFLRMRLVPDEYDRAGMVVNQYLAPDQLDKLVLVDSTLGSVWRAMCHIDSAKASYQIIPPGAAFDRSTVAPGKDWILLMGDHEVKGRPHVQVGNRAFQLLRRTDTVDVDFTSANLSGWVESAQGLAGTGAGGTWSSADLVKLTFTEPLPANFRLTLVAYPFGPNTGREFEMDVGGTKTAFVLRSGGKETVELVVSNPERSRDLTIKVPAPTSPKSLGMGEDDRRLGIGFVRMTFTPAS